MVSINTIKSWFQRGMKPTAAQFAAVFDSFWHKSEKIQISDVESLDSELSDIKDTIQDMGNRHSVNFSYQDGTPIAVQEVNNGGFIPELPAVEDDKTRNSWQGKKLSELVNITEDTEVIRYQFPDRTKYVFGWENGTMNYSDTEFMEDKELLTTLSVPDGTETVSWHALINCVKLCAVTLAEELLEIKDGAFKGCKNLVEINLPASLTAIGAEAFYAAPILGDLDLTAMDTETIGDYAFSGTKLNSVVVSDTVELGEGVFSFCTRLKSVTLPATLEEIPDHSFEGCCLLRDIELPSTLMSVGDYSFARTGLYAVTLPVGTNIGSGAFAYCSELGSVVIPEGIGEIGAYAFAYCDKLGSLELPEGIETLEKGREFAYSGLDEISLPSTLKRVGSSFSGCSKLQEVTLPAGIEQLSGTFEYCESLERVTFDKGDAEVVEDLPELILDSGTFSGCTSLREVSFRTVDVPAKFGRIGDYKFPVDETFHVTKDGAFSGYGNDGAWLRCRGESTDSSHSYALTLGDTITFTDNGMEAYAKYQYNDGGSHNNTINFSDYYTIQLELQCQFRLGSKVFEPGIYTVSLEDGVVKTTGNTSIYSSVFRYIGLTHIELPEGVTGIYQEAFACSALESVVLPASVNNMGDSVFSYCESIGSIDLSRTSIASIGGSIMGLFNENHNITLYLPHSVGSCRGQFGSVKELVVTSNLTDSGAFIRSEDLTRLVFARAPFRLDKDMFKYSWESLQTNNIEVIEIPYMWEPNVNAADNIFFVFPGITTETLDIMLNRLGYAQNGTMTIYVHPDRQGEISQTTLDRLATRGYTIEYTIS